MLPMHYRPSAAEVPHRRFELRPPHEKAASQWLDALTWALRFWNLAAGDSRISHGFRVICEENAKALEAARLGPRLLHH